MISAIRDAVSDGLGWLLAVIVAVSTGFCAGYWFGYGQVTPITQTLGALAHLPLLWLGSGWVFLAYAVTGMAWYLPTYFESLRLRICAVIATVIIWACVIAPLAEQAAHSKFVRF